jgi:heavy metal translocating P-type ATPase
MSEIAAEAGCTYCGLPVPSPWRKARTEAAVPEYCCFGCRVAHQVTGAVGEDGHTRWMLTRLGIGVFFAMNVMAFTMALWTQDVYADPAADRLSTTLYGLFRQLCLLFTLPVLFLLGLPLLGNAWDAWRRGLLNVDLLLLAGVAAAVVVSAISVWRDEGPVYFEVACAVLVLVTLGRWLEARGKWLATEALAGLDRLLPGTVRLVSDSGERVQPRLNVAVGDRIHVVAGERIPCDGTVMGRAAIVDEQILTGETRGSTKQPGDMAHAGTLNVDGDLYLEVLSRGGGAIERIMRLMREARMARGHYERLAERLARVMLPAVALIALAVAAVHTWMHGVDRGIFAGLSVVLIACPCALGVATPLAVWAALGRAARRGVLFRSGEALERLASIKTIAFDKTGTLTTGQPRLTEWHGGAETSADELWRRTRQMAQASTHGMAQALLAREPVTANAPEYKGVFATRSLPGRGMVAVSGGDVMLLGSLRLMQEHRQVMPEPLESLAHDAEDSCRPVSAVAWDGRVRGLFVFEETVRPDAQASLAELRRQGLHVCVLTGDHRNSAARLAGDLSVPVEAELLPEDKLAHLARLRAAGPVAMVGDGINDGPALAASDVGIALGCGADVTRAAASVCLLGDRLSDIPWAIALARRTTRIIGQNLFWAFAYNIFGVGLACTGRLNPVWAALAMILSGGFVLVSSLRLTRDIASEA